jgi:hypothetical protein
VSDVLGDPGISGVEALGGAIACFGSNPTIRQCIITDSVADGSAGDGAFGVPDEDPNNMIPGGNGGDAAIAGGGGIYCDATSSPLIEDCEIIDCQVIANGGDGGDGQDPAEFNSPEFDCENFDPQEPGFEEGGVGGAGGSSASAFGGGIYCEAGSGAVIKNCLVSNNQVFAYPGWGAEIAETAGDDGTSGGDVFGGGIYYGAVSTVDIENTTVSNNVVGGVDSEERLCGAGDDRERSSSGKGGALWCDLNCNVTITGSQFSGNDATASAGGLGFEHNSTAALTGCTVESNQSSDDGGGIWLGKDGTLTLDNTRVDGNSTPEGSNKAGGGIFAESAGASNTTIVEILNNSIIVDNYSDFGGGMGLEDPNLTVENSTITRNTARYGGGVYCSSGEASLSGDTLIENNFAEGGAGLYYLNSAFNMSADVIVRGNYASSYGGGIYISGPADAGGSQTITDCDIIGNSSEYDGGGISCKYGALLEIDNSDISQNILFSDNGIGGGLSCYDAFVGINNSDFEDNLAIYGGSQISVGDPFGLDDPSSVVFIDYSNVAGGEEDILVADGFGPWLWYGPNNTATVKGDPVLVVFINGDGTVVALDIDEPASGTQWPLGTVVKLQAIPTNASDGVRWLGTDDDTELGNFNEVTMSTSKIITVDFAERTLFDVNGDITELQIAFDTAQDGDIIILHPGIYDPIPGPWMQIDKNIVLQGSNPDDPETVENTVIRGTGLFFEGTNRRMVINGITFSDIDYKGGDGCDGNDESCGNPLPDGQNGTSLAGSALLLWNDASATVKNCRFENCSVRGGYGGNGADCGDGGWGGFGRGGAVYIGSGDPRFINCRFIDNFARGGAGGDGDLSGACSDRGGSWEDPFRPNPW